MRNRTMRNDSLHISPNPLPSCNLIVLTTVVIATCYAAIGGGNWCSLDTGQTTITDSHGYPHSVYISATRDGSIWLKAGRDHATRDWIYKDERTARIQSVILEPEMITIFQSINYTEYCVLTDLDMSVTVASGWHPSHLDVFEPKQKENRIILFRHNQKCEMSTNLTLTPDKQRLLCDGGLQNGCGKRYLPEAGQSSATTFIKAVNFDTKRTDHWRCDAENDLNSFTFFGSYYNVYVKLASCDIPKESRVWGHEAKLRPHRDHSRDMILIPDPTQTALSDDVIRGWHIFANIISVEHGVYLQVWRPSHDKGPGGSGAPDRKGDADAETGQRAYTLVGQTFYRPSELRLQETTLMPHQMIYVRHGDVLGLQLAKFNPLAWSTVPCAYEQQRFKFFETRDPVKVGSTVNFTSAPPGDSACRQYSFTAVLTDKPNAKIIEDWICPTAKIAFSTRRVHDSQRTRSEQGGSDVIQTGKRPMKGVNRHSPSSSLSSSSSSSSLSNDYNGDNVMQIKYIFLIVGCLSLMLLAVGIISYFFAALS